MCGSLHSRGWWCQALAVVPWVLPEPTSPDWQVRWQTDYCEKNAVTAGLREAGTFSQADAVLKPLLSGDALERSPHCRLQAAAL